MKQSCLEQKSYNKSKSQRKKFRHEIFQKNRRFTQYQYLSYYDVDTQQKIIESLNGPIPVSLLASTHAVRSTISYYRRNNQFVYKTRLEPQDPLDPHMVHESLWSLVAQENPHSIPNYEEVVKQFQRDLPLYLQIPYKQIFQLAAIVAGNYIIGKCEQILKIVQKDQTYIWVMINHIYQGNISSKYLEKYIYNNQLIIYRSIFELSNKKKDQIIFYMIQNEQLLSKIIQNLTQKNVDEQIKDFSVRILGNILAQAQDYAGQLSKYHLLDKIFPLLYSKNERMRRDACWMLANYAYEPHSSNQMLYKQKLMSKLLIMMKNQNKLQVRKQLYFVFNHLVKFGQKHKTYEIALKQNFLDICLQDLEQQDVDLTISILHLIYQLVKVGEQFITNEQFQMQQNTYIGIQNDICNTNPFANQIKSTNLKNQINRKSYHQNQQIRRLSAQILQSINDQVDEFGIF